MLGKYIYMTNRTFVFLIIHAIILISIFALRFIGFSSDHLLVIAVAAISLEAIYLILFTGAKVNRIAGNLKEIEKEMAEIREDAMDVERIQRELLYAAHQMSRGTSGVFKPSGNGHNKRTHSQTVSRS